MPEEGLEEPTGAPDEDFIKGKDLVYAARTGALDDVKQLLDEGTPVGFHDGPAGWTALKWAASEGHEEVLALLLEHGAA